MTHLREILAWTDQLRPPCEADTKRGWQALEAARRLSHKILADQEHPKIERKLSELVRRHGARRARYRGRWKVLIGGLLVGTVVNIKRMVYLFSPPKLASEGV